MDLPCRHLSLRELQVLRLAAEGLTAKGTARVLQISESAVNLYLTHARQKLGAKTKAEAIASLGDSGDLVTESITHMKAMVRAGAALQNDRLQEMLILSNKLRHMLENMFLAEASRTVEKCNVDVWNNLAEKFLVIAAQTYGYQVVKDQETGPDHNQLGDR
jgi:DNA-binding CsgD family transcriptional regulator